MRPADIANAAGPPDSRGDAAARTRRGADLGRAGRTDEALAELDAALRIDPACAQAHAVRGRVLRRVGMFTYAIAAHRAALASGADPAESWNDVGLCLLESGDAEAAMTAFRRALAARPGFAQARANLHACAQRVPGTPAARLRAIAGAAPGPGDGGQPRAAHAGARRLRVGYLSSHFFDHPMGRFLRGLLRHHDPRRVEVHAYASQDVRDALTEALVAAAPHWAFVGDLADEALAHRIRGDRIDVLVDLSGHAGADRPGVWERRAAPVQLGWAGRGNGVPGIDAILAGREVLAAGSEEYFAAPVVRLDGSPTACTVPEEEPEPVAPPGREAVFGCLAGLDGLNDAVVGAWCAILLGQPGSKLVLRAAGFNDPRVSQAVQRRFATRGVEPGRLELRGPVPPRDAREEHEDVDIALDPFPAGAADATCEALWMGVPVVTLAGLAPASRESAPVLRAAGLADLVARTPRQYVSHALALARDGPRRAALRGELRSRMRALAIADGRKVAAELETVYERLAGARTKPG